MKNRLSYFNDFVINEAKKTKSVRGIKVVLLSNVSEESKSVPAIKAECEKRGLKFVVIDIDKCGLRTMEKDKEKNLRMSMYNSSSSSSSSSPFSKYSMSYSNNYSKKDGGKTRASNARKNAKK